MIDEVFFENKHLRELNPHDVGCEKCEPLHSCGPEKRDHYVMQFVISGQGILRLNHKTYTIHENQVFIIPPDTMYYYEADKNDPWEYTWLNFDGERAKELSSLPSPIINMDYKLFADLLQCRNYPSMEAEYLAGRLFIIFAELLKKSNSPNYTILVKEYITAHYMQQLSISHIAKVINLNRQYLSRLFKKETGETMQQFLINLRMLKAMNMVKNHTHNISTIARLSGYSDVYAFSKSFKKHFGSSPTCYFPDENLTDAEL